MDRKFETGQADAEQAAAHGFPPALVDAVNEYIAYGLVMGHWGREPDKRGESAREIRSVFLLNGSTPTHWLGGRTGEGFIEGVKALVAKSPQDIQEKLLEIKPEVASWKLPELPKPPERKPNYVELLRARGLVLRGDHTQEGITHGIDTGENPPRVIRVKPRVTKLKLPDGREKVITLLKPVDESGKVIPWR